MLIKIFITLFLFSSCAIQTINSQCDVYCSSIGEECAGVRATGTKARAMVLGRAADFSRKKNIYRCQKKTPVDTP